MNANWKAAHRGIKLIHVIPQNVTLMPDCADGAHTVQSKHMLGKSKKNTQLHRKAKHSYPYMLCTRSVVCMIYIFREHQARSLDELQELWRTTKEGKITPSKLEASPLLRKHISGCICLSNMTRLLRIIHFDEIASVDVLCGHGIKECFKHEVGTYSS